MYQMLKMVPVWGGGSDFDVEGSTWGRAGRRLRRMIFFVFFSSVVTIVSVVFVEGTRVWMVFAVVRSIVAVSGDSEV